MRRTLILSCVVAAAIVTTACQHGVYLADRPIFAPRFGLEATTSAPVPVSAATAPGTMTVSLAGFLSQMAQRRVLAVVADIERVVVVVRQPDQPERLQTVAREAIINGQTTCTFTDLPVGAVTVTVTAYDAGGKAIGSASEDTTVGADAGTMVSLTVQLDPTEVAATPAPSGSGGTSGTTAGSLEAHATFVDGPVVVVEPTPMPAGTVVASFGVPHSLGLFASGSGQLMAATILGGSGMTFSYAYIALSSSDGTEQWRANGSLPSGKLGQEAGPLVYDRAHDRLWVGGLMPASGEHIERFRLAPTKESFAVDASGNALVLKVVSGFQWEETSYFLQRVAPDGAYTPTLMEGTHAIAIDPAGNTWTGWVPMPAPSPASTPQASLRRYAPDANLIDTIDLPFVPRSLVGDSSGAMWVTDVPTGGLKTLATSTIGTANMVKVEADGTVGTPLSLPMANFCVDESDNVWVAGGMTVTKLRPDGTTALTLTMPAKFVTSGDGFVYVGDGHTVSKIVP